MLSCEPILADRMLLVAAVSQIHRSH